MSFQVTPKNNLWQPCLLAALFAAYAFFQMNMIDVLNHHLVKSFNLSQYQIGLLASIYLYTDAAFLIPAGFCLDRFPLRRIMLFAISLSTIGVLLFSMANHYYWLCIARVISAIGHSFALLSCFRLITKYIQLKYRGIFIGVTLTIALMGSALSQAPFNILIHAVGWREALLVDFSLGVLLLVVFYCSSKTLHTLGQSRGKYSFQQMAENIKLLLKNYQNWLSACYIIFQNFPLMLLGAAWGIAYLANVNHLSSINASIATMLLFVGIMLGSPVLGLLSDSLKKRRPILKFVSILALLVMLVIKFLPLNFYMVLLLFLILGFCSGSQSLGYLMIDENSPRSMSSFFMSFFNVIIMLGCGTTQLLSGQFFSSAAHYHLLTDIIILGMIAATLIAFFSKETCPSD